MKSDIDQEVREDRGLIAGIIFLIFLAIYACYPYLPTVIAKAKQSDFHVHTSSVLLIVLVGLYFYASVFYKDKFYRFIALGWAVHWLYSYTGIGAPDQSQYSEYVKFRSSQMLLALIADVPFYFAALQRSHYKVDYRKFFVPGLAIFAWFFIVLIGVGHKIQAKAHVILASGFATYVLFKVYKSIKVKAEAKLHRHLVILFRLTFLVYAFLQVAFVIVVWDKTRSFIPWLMGAALLVKLANLTVLVLLLRKDYAEFIAQHTKLQLEEEGVKEDIRKLNEFEELGILAASIEHELRVPLGVIDNQLNIMRSKYQADPLLMEELDRLERQRVRMLAATGIIKTLRPSETRFSEKMEIVNLSDLAKRAIKDLKISLPSEKIAVNDIYFKLHEAKKELSTLAHRPLLQQVFTNVLKNSVEAIHSLPHRTGTIEIVLKTSSNSTETIQAEITDNGPGFPLEYMHMLTKPGFSLADRDKENRGLGLFISEKILQIHNGNITFNNAKEGGAIVVITLPRQLSKRQRMATVAELTVADKTA